MKAIICTKYGPAEVLQLKEVGKPIPKDNEILIKVYATTVTSADYKIRSFQSSIMYWVPMRIMLGLRKPRKSILGRELAGEIEAIGKNVKNSRKVTRFLLLLACILVLTLNMHVCLKMVL